MQLHFNRTVGSYVVFVYRTLFGWQKSLNLFVLVPHQVKVELDSLKHAEHLGYLMGLLTLVKPFNFVLKVFDTILRLAERQVR